MKLTRMIFLCFFPLLGCFSSGGVEADPSLRDITVSTRMEFIENHGNRDSLVDVHLAVTISGTTIGSRYRVRMEFTTAERGFIQGYEDDSFASDTAMAVSRTFTQEVAKLKGQTLQAAVSLNGQAFAQDSATFY